ncbi:MAG: hypothetical protein NC204_02670 [Candidatus Amulumruptor caecigallinarius]|nr:hypothetical protein [Candidatus Amulumruptor caecigallinarius]
MKIYIYQADASLASFVVASAGERIKSAERQMLEQYQANKKEVLPSNWKTIGLSVLGSFIFSAVVTMALILEAFSEKYKAVLVNKIVDEQSVSNGAHMVELADSIHNPMWLNLRIQRKLANFASAGGVCVRVRLCAPWREERADTRL